MDKQDNTITADQILVKSLTTAAHAVVAAASAAGDCRQLQVHIHLGLGSANGNAEPNPTPPLPSPGKREPSGADIIIKKYPDGFAYARKILLKMGGRARLGDLVAELDAETIAPFHKAAPEKALAWLSRYFGRNSSFRFNPVAKPSETTMDTEVWTVAAWKNKHQLQQSSGLQPGLV